MARLAASESDAVQFDAPPVMEGVLASEQAGWHSATRRRRSVKVCSDHGFAAKFLESESDVVAGGLTIEIIHEDH